MGTVPPETADAMMVKCARRCCVCRRFRPTKLQVHHITERSSGGSDEEGNLIVVCFSCHSDVHSRVPFARRFTRAELAGHRDALVAAVAVGVFPSDDCDDADPALGRVAGSAVASLAAPSLLPEAVELLLRAVAVEGGAQGHISATDYDGGFAAWVGHGAALAGNWDKRTQAACKRGLGQLAGSGLVERDGEASYEVAHDGYLAADEIASLGSGAPPGEKV